MTPYLEAAGELLAGFPSRNLALVMLVVVLVLSCIAFAAWIVEAAQKQAARVKARAEADSKEALECSKYYR